MRFLSAFSLTFLTFLSCVASAEPELKGEKVISLISGKSLDGWKVSSSKWSIKDGVITGDTGGEKLKIPEWIYLWLL